MKARRKRRGMCSMCLVICLLWGILGGSAAALCHGRRNVFGSLAGSSQKYAGGVGLYGAELAVRLHEESIVVVGNM